MQETGDMFQILLVKNKRTNLKYNLQLVLEKWIIEPLS